MRLRMSCPYAAAVGASLLLLAACGAEQPPLPGRPTTPSPPPPAVSAPPVTDPDSSPPALSATPAAAPTAAAPSTTARPSPAPGPASTPLPTRRSPAPRPAPVPAPPVPGALRIVQASIPYPSTRLQEMAAYSLRHYGAASWQLTPSVIVLHFTAGSSWTAARNTFAADTVSMGELPGTCAHFIIDKDGTVYQLVPTTIRCRHTIGLNDVAIGIEMVQEAGSSSAWADRQILNRPAQIGAALALVRNLRAQYGISAGNVIGHAMANSAPQFHDLLGWRNDHTDWQPTDVTQFRSRL